MKHSFGLDVLCCPCCKGRLRFVAVIFDRVEVERLLCHLRCLRDPLPVHPARGPPEHEEVLDQRAPRRTVLPDATPTARRNLALEPHGIDPPRSCSAS